MFRKEDTCTTLSPGRKTKVKRWMHTPADTSSSGAALYKSSLLVCVHPGARLGTCHLALPLVRSPPQSSGSTVPQLPLLYVLISLPDAAVAVARLCLQWSNLEELAICRLLWPTPTYCIHQFWAFTQCELNLRTKPQTWALAEPEKWWKCAISVTNTWLSQWDRFDCCHLLFFPSCTTVAAAASGSWNGFYKTVLFA